MGDKIKQTLGQTIALNELGNLTLVAVSTAAGQTLPGVHVDRNTAFWLRKRLEIVAWIVGCTL